MYHTLKELITFLILCEISCGLTYEIIKDESNIQKMSNKKLLDSYLMLRPIYYNPVKG